jgi:hypothetical protein
MNKTNNIKDVRKRMVVYHCQSRLENEFDHLCNNKKK